MKAIRTGPSGPGPRRYRRASARGARAPAVLLPRAPRPAREPAAAAAAAPARPGTRTGCATTESAAHPGAADRGAARFRSASSAPRVFDRQRLDDRRRRDFRAATSPRPRARQPAAPPTTAIVAVRFRFMAVPPDRSTQFPVRLCYYSSCTLPRLPRGSNSVLPLTIVAIIPARYASTRLPGKALADLDGRPMIEHVYRRAAAARSISSVIVRDGRFADCHARQRFRRQSAADEGDARNRHRPPRRSGGVARLRHRRQRPGRRAADRPALHRRAGGALRHRSRGADDHLVPPHPRRHRAEQSEHHQAGHRSRRLCAVFLPRADPLRAQHRRAAGRPLYRHIGLYAYRRSALLVLASLEQTPLERAESLEQLRALEHGIRIKAVETAYESFGVDTHPKIWNRCAACSRRRRAEDSQGQR